MATDCEIACPRMQAVLQFYGSAAEGQTLDAQRPYYRGASQTISEFTARCPGPVPPRSRRDPFECGRDNDTIDIHFT